MLVLALPAVLVACSFSPPSPAITDSAELVGRWDVVDEGSESAALELRADGTAAFENIPRGALDLDQLDDESLDWRDTLTTTGTWDTTDHRSSGYPYVRLYAGPDEGGTFEGSSVRLLVDKTKEPTRVFLQFGPERPSRLNFEKE